MDRQPTTAESVRHPSRPAEERFGKRTRSNSDKQTVAGLPRVGIGLRSTKLASINTDMVGHEAQRNLSQSGKVSLAKEIPRGGGSPIRQIHFAFVQALDEFGGWQIH